MTELLIPKGDLCCLKKRVFEHCKILGKPLIKHRYCPIDEVTFILIAYEIAAIRAERGCSGFKQLWEPSGRSNGMVYQQAIIDALNYLGTEKGHFYQAEREQRQMTKCLTAALEERFL